MEQSNKNFDYRKENIIAALRAVGLQKGDCIFTHSNIGFFGKLKGAKSREDYYTFFKEAILEVVGKEGTFVVPTFSYSFFQKKVYDPKNSLGIGGFFAESVRLDQESKRSADPNYSVCAIGRRAIELTGDIAEHSFGPDSFWERFLKMGGKFCNFNFDAASTFLHYVERELRVPYRFDKEFKGKVIANGIEQERKQYHFVYDLNKPTHISIFTRFDNLAKDLGFAKVTNLGRGQVVCISAADSFEVMKIGLKNNPGFLIEKF